jgi:hypothetical protein
MLKKAVAIKAPKAILKLDSIILSAFPAKSLKERLPINIKEPKIAPDVKQKINLLLVLQNFHR